MGKHAVDQAMRIKEAFKDKGYRFLVDSPSNQQFYSFLEMQKTNFLKIMHLNVKVTSDKRNS